MTETKPEVVVLLYYKYVPIENAEEYAKQHLDYCKSIGLLGRIIVAKEGINGTVSGTKELTDTYIEYMHSDPRFADMEFKVELYQKHPLLTSSSVSRDTSEKRAPRPTLGARQA